MAFLLSGPGISVRIMGPAGSSGKRDGVPLSAATALAAAEA